MNNSYTINQSYSLAGGTNVQAGSVVYRFNGYDYGLSADDTRFTGKPHTAVTFNPDGSAPFFTVNEEYLEPRNEVIANMVHSLINPPLHAGKDNV